MMVMRCEMAKPILIRLPDWAVEKLEKKGELKGLSLATTIRELICETLNGSAPVAACKPATDATATSLKPEAV